MRNQFPHIRIDAIVTALPGGADTPPPACFRAPEAQTASDLGFAAAARILGESAIDPSRIGALVFASKTPDYRSPATACVLHGRLGLSRHCAAFDLNSGSVGWLHAIQVTAALLEAGQLTAGLVVAGDTTSRQFRADDSAAATYGDGAVAILLRRESRACASPLVIECVSDGRGARQFFFGSGGFRYPSHLTDFAAAHPLKALASGHLEVDGAAFSRSARQCLPPFLQGFAATFEGGLAGFDRVLVQQISAELVETVRSQLNLPEEGVPLHEGVPDLGTASVPALLADQWPRLRRKPVSRILGCAFGEGLSWGCGAISLEDTALVELIHSDEVFAHAAVPHEE